MSAHGLWCFADIMVQEFVEYGALDLYLKRGRSVSVSWKLDVAKQLASVLTFLVRQPHSDLPRLHRHLFTGSERLNRSSVFAGAT